MIPKIVITTGDVDGVGLEVSFKALAQIEPAGAPVHFLIFHSSEHLVDWQKIPMPTQTISDTGDFLKATDKLCKLFVLTNSESPVRWFQNAVEMANEKKIHAIVTAPMSKTLISGQGLDDIGHTEILKRMTGAQNTLMVFLGDKFNVLLATGHIPLSEVPRRLTGEVISEAFRAAKNLKAKMGWQKPIAVLGLNPHSGEDGLIGNEDQLIKDLLKKENDIEGPLVPDAAFLSQNWGQYSLYISLYHDQGLIPFKMIHGHDSGVHLTYGIDFVRTSVDHGTAKEIFGKNQANPASMLAAIESAVSLVQSKG